MAGALTRGVMFAVFTGGADDIEKRTDAMEKDMERRMDARGKALEARADALCVKVKELDELQRQLDYRLSDGKSLLLLERTEHSAKPSSAMVRDTKATSGSRQ